MPLVFDLARGEMAKICYIMPFLNFQMSSKRVSRDFSSIYISKDTTEKKDIIHFSGYQRPNRIPSTSRRLSVPRKARPDGIGFLRAHVEQDDAAACNMPRKISKGVSSCQ